MEVIPLCKGFHREQVVQDFCYWTNAASKSKPWLLKSRILRLDPLKTLDDKGNILNIWAIIDLYSCNCTYDNVSMYSLFGVQTYSLPTSRQKQTRKFKTNHVRFTKSISAQLCHLFLAEFIRFNQSGNPWNKGSQNLNPQNRQFAHLITATHSYLRDHCRYSGIHGVLGATPAFSKRDIDNSFGFC